MPCRRCRSRGEECAYEDKKWRTKDHLRSEIERLRAEQRQEHALIRALTNNDAEQCEAVLDRLRSDESPDSIAQWIQSATACPSTPDQPPQGLMDGARFGVASSPLYSPFRSTASQGSEAIRADRLRATSFSSPSCHSLGTGMSFGGGSGLSPSPGSFSYASRGSFSAEPSPTRRFSVQEGRGFPQLPPLVTNIPSLSGNCLAKQPGGLWSEPPNVLEEPVLRSWTSITADTQFVERLISKFFATSFSPLSPISQPQFIKGFRERSQLYCSESLVNAVLGRACKSFDSASQLISRVSFGDAFLGEAKRLLSAEQTHVALPSIQALGVLALVELSQGNDEEAWDLAEESVRSSIRLTLHTQGLCHDHEYEASRALAYCESFTLMR